MSKFIITDTIHFTKCSISTLFVEPRFSWILFLVHPCNQLLIKVRNQKTFCVDKAIVHYLSNRLPLKFINYFSKIDGNK